MNAKELESIRKYRRMSGAVHLTDEEILMCIDSMSFGLPFERDSNTVEAIQEKEAFKAPGPTVSLREWLVILLVIVGLLVVLDRCAPH